MGLASLVDDFRNWRDRRLVTAELRRLQRSEQPYKQAEGAALLNTIKEAAFREDPEKTEQAFLALRAHSPELAMTSFTAISALLTVGKTELAEATMMEGLRHFPGSRDLMGFHAQMANRRGDFEEASRRWEVVRTKFPGNFWACFWQAMALKELKRFDAADKLLEEAMAIDPLHPIAATRYAQVAEQRGDLAEALRRWHLMRERVEDQAGWVGSARVLCLMGREDEAVALLDQARWRFQSRPEPMVELAQICHRRGPSEEAARQWASVRDLFPQIEEGFIAGARALCELGRPDEADAVLRRYAEKPDPSPGGMSQWARSIQPRDPREAARRWAVVRERFPEREEAYVLGAEALDAIGETAEAQQVRMQTRVARRRPLAPEQSIIDMNIASVDNQRSD
jgi:predicted Zn-dependent protease